MICFSDREILKPLKPLVFLSKILDFSNHEAKFSNFGKKLANVGKKKKYLPETAVEAWKHAATF